MVVVHEVPPASSFLLCVVRAVGWGTVGLGVPGAHFGP